LWIVWGLIVLFGFLTIWRNQIWHDPETLYTQTLKSHLDVAHFRLGFADILLKRDDDAGARSQIDAAIMVLNSGKYLTQEQDNHRAVIGLGVLEARAGHYAEAKERFLSALRLSPGDPWPYVYLGGIAIRQEEDFPRAIEYLTKAIELDPILDLARDYMGIALFNSGRIAEATAQFEAALQINPYSRDARLHLNMSRTALQKVH
jgi:tetratricopeptide (TPR) repeat protein